MIIPVSRTYHCLTQVVLPLSTNHGPFGNDRLYSESKIHPSTVGHPKAGVNIFVSQVPLLGEYAVTGRICNSETPFSWTRGTNLMA